MTVVFNSTEEFLEELDKDRKKIDRRIVRLTVLHQESKLSPNIKHLHAMATFLVKGEIVMLSEYCGDIWGIETERNDVTAKRVDDKLGAVETFCKMHRLEVRSGKLEK
jgi:hypothetical protein